MKKIISLSFILGFFSLQAQPQLISDSVQIDGRYRTFHFYKPVSANSSLVFILHGSGGTGKQMIPNTVKLQEKSIVKNILLAYPDGYKKYWNECRKAASSLANKENIDENKFFDAMIVYFKTRYQINPKQVFGIGTSGGGHMCYKLAMTMPEKITAIVALIANLPDDDNMDCMDRKIAVPVMIVNGTADGLNPYEGGMMQAGDLILGKVRSTSRTFQYWAGLAGYNGEPLKESLPDTDPSDGKTIERYTYKQTGKAEVTLLKVIGGKHDYPNDIDVHLEGWEFCERQIRK